MQLSIKNFIQPLRYLSMLTIMMRVWICFLFPKLLFNPKNELVPTGIAMQIPDGYVGLIWDKSGISQKFGLKTLGGVVDAGYRGEIFVGLYNTGDIPHTFEAGQKLAQIIIQKIEQPEVIEVLETR